MKIKIDDKLISEAQKLTGITEKEVMIEKLLIAMETQKKLMNLRGKIKLDDEAFK